MLLGNWLITIAERYQATRRIGRSRRRPVRRHRRSAVGHRFVAAQSVETLEDRTLLSMNTVFMDEVYDDVFIERREVVVSLDELESGLRDDVAELNLVGLQFQFNPTAGTPQLVIDGFAEAGQLCKSNPKFQIQISPQISLETCE